MDWQVWVPLAVALAALVVVVVARFHHASRVLHGLIGEIDEHRADEVAQRRREREREQLPDFDHRRTGDNTR